MTIDFKYIAKFLVYLVNMQTQQIGYNSENWQLASSSIGQMEPFAVEDDWILYIKHCRAVL